MIFWRVFDNNLYPVEETDNLGFEKSEGLRIPDEYLKNQEFVVMRTCHGVGDWVIISSMPRLLKNKYPDCKVYLPSHKLLKKLFGQYEKNWGVWGNPFLNLNAVFDNNPYIDGYKDSIEGEVFHDHYRIYDMDNPDIPLVEQMLQFWQFEKSEYEDSQPEMYWSDKEKELGDSIIKEHVGNSEFGTLLTTKRIMDGDEEKILKVLSDNQIPYFYYTHESLKETPFNVIDKALDMRHMDIRLQLYIKSKAKLNIGNQCGVNHMVIRYSNVYEVQRQFPIGSNFVKGEIYL